MSNENNDVFKKIKGIFQDLKNKIIEHLQKLQAELQGLVKNSKAQEDISLTIHQELDTKINSNENLIVTIFEPIDNQFKIDEVTNLTLNDYVGILHGMIDFNTMEQGIYPLILQIQEETSIQTQDDQLKNEYLVKREMLYSTYVSLIAPCTTFKVKKVQDEAIAILRNGEEDFRFWDSLKNAPIETVQHELSQINATISRLSCCLEKAKITSKVVQENLYAIYTAKKASAQYQDHKIAKAIEPLINAAHYREHHLSIGVVQVEQLKIILVQQGFIILHEDIYLHPGVDKSDPEQEYMTITLTVWSREELVAYYKSLADFTNVALLKHISSYPSAHTQDLAHFQAAMAFNYQTTITQALECPSSFLDQCSEYFALLCGNEGELDVSLKKIYTLKTQLNHDFQKQYPQINHECVLDGLQELIKSYNELQQKLTLPVNDEFELYSFKELIELKKLRDEIALAYQNNYLSRIEKESTFAQQGVSPDLHLIHDLIRLRELIKEQALHVFLDQRVVTQLERHIKTLQQQRQYENLTQLYYEQEIALGHIIAIDSFDFSTDFTKKLAQIKEKIRENIKHYSASFASNNLKILVDFDEESDFI